MSCRTWRAANSMSGATATRVAPDSASRVSPSAMVGRTRSRKDTSTRMRGSATRMSWVNSRNARHPWASDVPWPTRRTPNRRWVSGSNVGGKASAMRLYRARWGNPRAFGGDPQGFSSPLYDAPRAGDAPKTAWETGRDPRFTGRTASQPPGRCADGPPARPHPCGPGKGAGAGRRRQKWTLRRFPAVPRTGPLR